MSAPMSGLIARGERRIHEPAAARRGVEEERAAQEDAADDEAPEAERREPRKRQIARALHLRQDEDRERLEDRDGEEEHHHGAVHREDLVVALGRQEVVVRERELDAHQQRERAAEQEEDERRGRVPDADVLVVDRRPVAPSLRRLPRLQQPLGLRALHVLPGRAGRVPGRRLTAGRPDRRRAPTGRPAASARKAGMCTPGLTRSVSRDPPHERVGLVRQRAGADAQTAADVRQVRTDRVRRLACRARCDRRVQPLAMNAASPRAASGIRRRAAPAAPAPRASARNRSAP